MIQHLSSLNAYNIVMLMNIVLAEFLVKEVHFVSDPPQDFFCPICTELLTEPFLTDCGHYLCHTCCGRLLESDKSECHECRRSNALETARVNKHLQRQVNDLKVYCKYHKEGCKWEGELRDLQAHLDPKKRKCNYLPTQLGKKGYELV